MEREKKVVDASVIVKWFAKEEDSEKAIQLLNKHISSEIILLVPERGLIETLNALRYKSSDNLNNLIEANKDLWRIQLVVERVNEFLLQKATQLSIKHKTTIYDAIYSALAQIHGVSLITADTKLSKLPNAILLRNI
jgi:predicted nucleic acid-binding protein